MQCKDTLEGEYRERINTARRWRRVLGGAVLVAFLALGGGALAQEMDSVS